MLQHAANVVLGQVDPPTPKKNSKPTDQHNTNHHSSQNSHEAHLQRTIQPHRNAIHTLKKDLSLDDPDTLIFHCNKLKQAQDALDQLRKTKKQDKLLSTFTQGAAHDVGPVYDPLTTNTSLYGTTLRNTKTITPPPHCHRDTF